MFIVLVNRTTAHIDGFACKTGGSGNESGGVVGYYAQNACGSITRGNLAGTGKGYGYERAADALKAARAVRSKVCKRCEAAALAQAEADEVEAAAALASRIALEEAEEAEEVKARKAEWEAYIEDCAVKAYRIEALLEADRVALLRRKAARREVESAAALEEAVGADECADEDAQPVMIRLIGLDDRYGPATGYRPFGPEVVPPGVTMDPGTRVLSGQYKGMKDMHDRGIAQINSDGDLVLL